MAKKHIALLMGQVEEPYQQGFLKGVMKRAFEYGYDVCVFSMFIKYQNSKEREVGDSNIYNLVNYDMFDAIIILSDTIQTPGVEKKLEKKISKIFKGPVVCIDTDSEYFYSFWTDGYTSVYALISHLIEHHNTKRIAYLTGRKNHVHSQRRVEAYKDSMKSHGLEIEDDWILYGDFWYTSGADAAEKLLRDRDNLPEAVVAANDCMAIGLAEEFEKNGIKIPEDILVAGYGTSAEGQCSPKSLTSTYIPADYYGGFAVDSIIRQMKGEAMIEPKPDVRLFIGESCGCESTIDDIYNSKRKKWTSNDSEEGYYSVHNNLMEDLFHATTLDDLFKTVYENIYYLRGIQHLEIFLNDAWLHEEKVLNNHFPEVGYSRSMMNVLSYDSDDAKLCRVGLDNMFDTNDLLPKYYEFEDPTAFIFVPIFYENRSFGYVMMSYGDSIKNYSEINRIWVKCVARALECYRRQYAIDIYEKRDSVKNSIKYPMKNKTQEQVQVKEAGYDEAEQKEITEVERILDNNLLTYHFQPIVNAVDGEIYSYEALMRSNSERKIPPLQIIKIAEILNRIDDVEKATFINVLNYAENHMEELEGKKLFINSIPGSRLEYSDFVQVEKKLSAFSGTAVVELTEQAELEDEELEELKQQYRRMGIGLAVDDYGTGYSNVSNLLRYMPDYVKIDRSLLSDIKNNAQKQHFVREVIDFCHANGIKALAEGVETVDELGTVIRLGADLLQGFYLARPAAEMISSIDSNIKMEISRFHREKEDDARELTYLAGRTNRISINTLIKEDKNTIVVGTKDATFRDLSIVGTPNTDTQIHIDVLDGYDGRITLENVNLSTVKNRPCIHMADNCNLTIRLVGENRFEGGGIKVPETSQLTIEGDGNLKLLLSGSETYGIGNSIDKGHGRLEFYQDGEIYIEANGQKTIGIGSGLGGDTRISKGKYSFYLSGDEGVGIGSLNGDQPIKIHDCDMMMDNTFYKGVYVGNLNNNADINVWRSLIRFSGSGKKLGIIGSVDGDMAKIHLHDLMYVVSVRSDYSTSMGTIAGTSDIRFRTATLKYKGVGKQAVVFGGCNENADIDIDNSTITIDIVCDDGKITKAPDDRVKEQNVAKKITINEKEIFT